MKITGFDDLEHTKPVDTFRELQQLVKDLEELAAVLKENHRQLTAQVNWILDKMTRK